VKFYEFEGIKSGKESAEVQRYLRDFDKLEFGEDDRKNMLKVMQQVYDDVESMMQECYELNPQAGLAFGTAKDADGKPVAPAIIPDAELLQLTLSELHGYTGDNDGRIIMSLAGELLDVSAGREMYGPGCGYSILAGHDVTRCLATMSLEPDDLDDLDWTPTSEQDEAALGNWLEKLKAKYPVAGSLKRDDGSEATAAMTEGLRQRNLAPKTVASSEEADKAKSADQPAAPSPAVEKCPISGKEGVGCPMSMFGIDVKPKAKATPKAKTAGAFMKGKSMVEAVKDSSGTTGESFIYRLCPLHWDDNTTRLLIVVAAAAWLSGIFVGWQLRKFAS